MGVDARFKLFLEKAHQKHFNKYDYSQVLYKNSYTKIKIVCPVHGAFEQLPHHHVSGSGCSLCAQKSANQKKLLSNDGFKKRSARVHNNKYDYSKVKYAGCRNVVIIICPEHGEFLQVANEHMRGHGCPQCGKEKSVGSNEHRTNEFISKAIQKHGNKYDYSMVRYENHLSKIEIICPVHGVFEQLPVNHLRYGCTKCAIKDKTLTTEEFINRARDVHGNKYDYLKVDYQHNKKKVIIICSKHGEFKQSPNSHLNGRNCPQCAREKMIVAVGDFNRSTTEEFIKKASVLHQNKYDYSQTNYIDNRNKVTIICREHGAFEQVAAYHIAGHGCSRCAGTKSQTELNEHIENLGFDTIFNDRAQIAPLELDIYIPSKNVAVEYHGLYWHSYSAPETIEEKTRHSTKVDLCERKGIRLIQIFENEWLDNEKIVESIIKSKLGVSDRIYARKCEIRTISPHEHVEFMNQNHIQGGKGCNVAYGLEYGDKLVAVMSFNKHPKYGWEITRFANSLGLTVVGGASRLFKKFLREIDPSQILTYADRRYSDGNLYRKLGFKLSGVTKPNYYYVKKYQIYSRQQFQKHKLKNKLKFFDPNFTEAENMFNNGYRRIWDAGHYRFTWR